MVVMSSMVVMLSMDVMSKVHQLSVKGYNVHCLHQQMINGCNVAKRCNVKCVHQQNNEMVNVCNVSIDVMSHGIPAYLWDENRGNSCLMFQTKLKTF